MTNFKYNISNFPNEKKLFISSYDSIYTNIEFWELASICFILKKYGVINNWIKTLKFIEIYIFMEVSRGLLNDEEIIELINKYENKFNMEYIEQHLSISSLISNKMYTSDNSNIWSKISEEFNEYYYNIIINLPLKTLTLITKFNDDLETLNFDQHDLKFGYIHLQAHLKSFFYDIRRNDEIKYTLENYIPNDIIKYGIIYYL